MYEEFYNAAIAGDILPFQRMEGNATFDINSVCNVLG